MIAKPTVTDLYRRVCETPTTVSTRKAWSSVLGGLTVEDLARLEAEARSIAYNFRSGLAEKLVALGHDRSIHVRDPEMRAAFDHWFIAPFLGKLQVHYGDGADSREWYCDEIDVEVANNVLDAGGYTVVLTDSNGYIVLETAKRIDPPHWASRYAEKQCPFAR